MYNKCPQKPKKKRIKDTESYMLTRCDNSQTNMSKSITIKTKGGNQRARARARARARQ